MTLSEKWQQLSGKTKMFVIGGGGIVLFFLFSAIKHKNSQAQPQQDTSVGPQQPAVDSSGWMDAQTQQVQSMQQAIGGINDSLMQYEQSNQQVAQQNQQSMQDLIQQNQQATQEVLTTFIGSMAAAPKYPSAPGPASSPKSSIPAKSTPKTNTSTSKEPAKIPAKSSAPKTNSTKTYSIKKGDNLWNIAKNKVLPKGASNADIQKEVNVLAKSNHITNPNVIRAGKKITLNGR